MLMEEPGPLPLAEHPRTGLHKTAVGLEPAQVGLGGSLFMCRHAEVDNPRQIIYGRLPRFGLTENGRRQAHELAGFLAGQDLSAIYISPLLRARQTARAIQAKFPHLRLQTDRDLLEVDTHYDGRPINEVGDYNFYEPLAHPDDETVEMVCERVVRFVRRVMTRHRGEHVAAVSHGDVSVVLHAFYFGFPMQLSSLRSPNFYPERASVTRYDFPPEGFTLDPDRVQISYYDPPFPHKV